MERLPSISKLIHDSTIVIVLLENERTMTRREKSNSLPQSLRILFFLSVMSFLSKYLYYFRLEVFVKAFCLGIKMIQSNRRAGSGFLIKFVFERSVSELNHGSIEHR